MCERIARARGELDDSALHQHRQLRAGSRSRPEHGRVEDLPRSPRCGGIFARADIEALVPLDANHDGKVSPEEWDSARPKLEPLAREALNVRVNDAAIAIAEPSFHLDENNNFRMAGIFLAQGAKALTVESPLIKRLPRGHRQFVSVLG